MTTAAGICHSAAWSNGRMTVGQAKRYRPQSVRTITLWRDDRSLWRETLASCQDLAELGIHVLVLFNTEAYGGTLRNIPLMQQRLDEFLELAKNEYSYIHQTTHLPTIPIHSLEPLNEIDTPGWTDGEGGPITADAIISYCYAMLDIAATHGIEVIGPSFLGGPQSDLPVAVIARMAQDHRISTAAFHFYGRSLMGQPYPGWIWGSVEDAVEQVLSYAGDMSIDISEGGCWTVDGGMGEDAQKRFVEAVCQFQHPRVRRIYLFAVNDWCPGEVEYQAGKDFGIETRDGGRKKASDAFNGGLIITKPQPTPVTPGPNYTFVLGFRKFRDKLVAGGIDPGLPLENEHGPWEFEQAQQTEHGLFLWAQLPEGGRLSYFHEGARQFRYDESWSSYQEITMRGPR